VLVLAASLTSSQPALEPRFVASAAAVPVRDGAVGDLQESVAVRPNRPGRNVVLIGVFDTRRPAPAPIRSVLITLVDPDGHAGQPIAATKLGDGQWSVSADIQSTTHYSIVVTVRRSGLSDETANYAWTVDGSLVGPARAAKVSNAPIRDVLRAASGMLLVVGLAGSAGLIFFRVRRRRWGAPGDLLVVDAQLDPVDIGS
jgi:copper transport protein